MNAHPLPVRPSGRASGQTRPEWPDAVLSADPEDMHPRAVEMAQAMREGTNTFRGLIGAGFTAAEIAEFNGEAKALATSLSSRQVSPGADLLAEMVEKAKAAVDSQRPLPKGASETQALVIAWSAYCRARAACVLDPWPTQRERCLEKLTAYFRQTPAGPNVTKHVVDAVAETLARLH